MKTHAALAAFVVLAAACSSSSSPPPGSSNDAGTTGDTGSSGDDGSSADGNAAGDTWTSYAQGFFTKYCVECHGAGNTNRDYTTITDVIRDKNIIRCGVAAAQDPSWNCASFPPPKQFPITDQAGTNPKPSDAERARIVAWITAGLPQ
jgi:hypothetical protein